MLTEVENSNWYMDSSHFLDYFPGFVMDGFLKYYDDLHIYLPLLVHNWHLQILIFALLFTKSQCMYVFLLMNYFNFLWILCSVLYTKALTPFNVLFKLLSSIYFIMIEIPVLQHFVLSWWFWACAIYYGLRRKWYYFEKRGRNALKIKLFSVEDLGLSALETAENRETLNYMNDGVFQKCSKKHSALTGLPRHKDCVRKSLVKLFE